MEERRVIRALRLQRIPAIAALAALAFLAAGQRPLPGQQNAPCSRPEARQFDFWIGDWGYTSNRGTGINNIRSVLGGCVIYESFNQVAGEEGDPLSGWSVSVFDAPAGKWKQTWVDNSGGYLDFVGEFKDGKMVLSREAEAAGKKFLQRMVWHNITRGAFDWNWERSEDGGKSWTALWEIHYFRKKPGS
jgi:hypothetical protein